MTDGQRSAGTDVLASWPVQKPLGYFITVSYIPELVYVGAIRVGGPGLTEPIQQLIEESALRLAHSGWGIKAGRAKQISWSWAIRVPANSRNHFHGTASGEFWMASPSSSSNWRAGVQIV